MTKQTFIGRIGLVVGLPLCGRSVAPEWAVSFASLNYPANMNLSISALKGIEVGEARCQIAQHAIDLKAKYLFFLDDDTAPPYFAARRLIYALEQAGPEVMVAGGIYANKHSYPPEPMVFLNDGDGPFWKWKYGEVFECGSIGTGCMMIKTEIFQYLEKPWFATINECFSSGEYGAHVHKLEMTDDLYFCKKVREAGFKILADGGVLCVHWDVLACACGHTLESHNKAQLHYPCAIQKCSCTSYRMVGKHYILPEDSFPLKRENNQATEIPKAEIPELQSNQVSS